MFEEGRRFFISSYSLPAHWQVDEIDMAVAKPLADVDEEVETRISNPLNSLALSDLCDAGDDIVILCDRAPTDQVRLAIVRGVLSHLDRAAIAPERVTLLIAAPDDASPADKELLGSIHAALHRLGDYAARVAVVQHDPEDLRELDDMGNFEGVPLTINYRAVEADVLIAIYAMQLDDDADCAGSCAAVTLGIVGTHAKRELHTTRFYDDQIEPSADRHPLLRRVLREGARRAGLAFAVGALVDAHGRPLAVRAGAPISVDDALADQAAALRESNVSRPSYDVVLADPSRNGHTAGSLFEASLAAIRLSLGRAPILLRGSPLILPVEGCEDGSSAARDFYNALINTASPELIIKQLQGRSLQAGEARAYLLAHAMQRNRLIIAGPQPERLARDFPILSSSSIREAAELAGNFTGKRPRALIVRHALSTTPVFRGLFSTPDSPRAAEPAPPPWRWN
ncbi:MAG: lactate racemase domain-containing protein [Thermoflexales bacterium]|nr:lactate racemase domain-containing protein [Thermoflexales bacterium]MDW8350922.1 lactate racemase domain-containing protein [Anaerolineae bacterium]